MLLVVLAPHGESAVTFSGNTIRIRGTNYLDTQTLMNEIYALEMSTPYDIVEEYFEAPDVPANGEWGYISPMDTGSFNRTQIWFTVDTDSTDAEISSWVTWSNGTTGIIRTPITGSGTVYFLTGSESIRDMNTSWLTVLNDGSYVDWVITQFRRGLFGRTDYNAYMFKDAGFAIGQSATPIKVSFDKVALVFNYTGWSSTPAPFIMAGSTSELRINNCSIWVDDTYVNLATGSNYIVSGTYKFFNVSDSYFKVFYPNRFSGSANNARYNFKNVICSNIGIYGGNVSLDNVYFSYPKDFGLYDIKSRYINDVTISNANSALAYSGYPYNVSNCVFTKSNYLFRPVFPISNSQSYLIDCKTDTFAVYGSLWNAGAKVHWSYTFKLRVKNETGNGVNLSGVTVKIYNRTGALKYSGTTDTYGQIPTQTLDDRYWSPTYYINGYIENPYHINLSKPGTHEAQNITLYITSPQNLTVNMDELEPTSCPSTDVTFVENLKNASGTHQTSYNSLTGWTIWNNYTGYNALNFIEHLINTTGTHQTFWTGTQWNIWNNYTGVTTPIHRFANIVNATGTHDYLLNGTGYWDWANYTGITTPLTLYANPVNATGTHVSWLTGSGYKVYANYTGLNGLNLFENIVNALGTHESQWTGSAWNIWANYTGTGGGGSAVPLIHVYDPNPANNTKIGGGYWKNSVIQANPYGCNFMMSFNYTDWFYGGSPDNLKLDITIYNKTWDWVDGDQIEDVTENGTYMFSSNLVNQTNQTYHWKVDVWSANKLDYVYENRWWQFNTSKDLNFIETLVNCTGTHENDYDITTGWTIWNNYTGVTTPLTLHQNPINATGTHVSVLKGDGYHVYANYTGLNGITLYDSLINAIGTHEKQWTGTQWKVWANYTGTGGGTALFLLHNPNPGNGTLSYNYLRRNPSGLKTAVDIVAVSWANPITLYWYSNTSGSWKLYATDSANANGTYQHLNVNMTNGSMKYWWRVVAKNITGVTLDNKTWSFETVKRDIVSIPSTSPTVGMLVPLTSLGLIGGMLGVRRRRKTQ